MFKESIALEALLEVFVAGGIFVIGAWYLHRPFLLAYFPAIAPDTILSESTTLGGKFLVVFVLAMLVGVFITHMFDAVVPFVIGSRTYIDKRLPFIKKVVTIFFRLILWIPEPDPRVMSVKRYLDSPRKAWFLSMSKSWCNSSEELLEADQEKVMVHQHIVARLRALPHAREVLQDAYNQVSFSGSIFTAFLLLIPVALLAFYTQTLVPNRSFSYFPVAYILGSIYIAAIVSVLSFRRRLRNFYGAIITLGIHFYDIHTRENQKNRQ